MSELERSDAKAEQAVLGSVLLQPARIYQAMEILRDPAAFFIPLYRRVWQSMIALHGARQPIDVLSVGLKMRDLGGEADPVMLAGCVESVPTAANVAFFATRVAEKAALRAVEEHAKNCVAWLHEETVPTTLEYIKSSAAEISIEDQGSAPESVSTTVTQALVGLQVLHEQDGKGTITGLRTGFEGIDDLLCGLQKGELILLAGRPAMGKTSLALDIALNSAAQEGAKWLFFSAETTRAQMGQRMLARASGIVLQKIRGVRVEPEEWARLAQAVAYYERLPVWMDYTAKLTPERVHAKAVQMHHETGLDGIVVDYVQRMKTIKDYDGNEHRRISHIAESLKDTALQLNVPVVGLAQLSRAVEKRPNKRPWLSDLRESGKLEEEADTVLFVYRDYVYNKNANPADVEIICAKQRMGPTGTRNLHFEGELVRFETKDRGQAAMF